MSESICRHFMRGVCLYGERCAFLHTFHPADADAPQATAEPSPLDTAAAEYKRLEARVQELRSSGAPRAALLDAVAQLKQQRDRCHQLRSGASRSRYASRGRVRNRERAGAFRRFLLDTYGLEGLQGGVLDIAGGQGALAFELLNLNGIEVTVVDPRPMSTYRLERKWDCGLYFRTEPLQQYNTCHVAHEAQGDDAEHAHDDADDGETQRPKRTLKGPGVRKDGGSTVERLPPQANSHDGGANCVDVDDGRTRCGSDVQLSSGSAASSGVGRAGGRITPYKCRIPRHWPCCWTPAVWEALLPSLQQLMEGRAAELASVAGGLGSVWPAPPLGEALREASIQLKRLITEAEAMRQGPDAEDRAQRERPQNTSSFAAHDGGKVPDGMELWETLSSCSAVVGMHPDAATEAIVDFALATGKHFAVVPCCVHASFFPNRRAKDGRLLTSYDEFLQYLLQKAPGRVRMAALPFEGKNTVLYTIASSAPPAARHTEAHCSPCDAG